MNSMTLPQLIAMGPTMLVYVIGFVLCGVNWRRAPFAAMLACIGTAAMTFAMLANLAMNNYVMNSRGSMSSSQWGAIMSASSFAISIIRAGGLAMVFAA